MAGRPENADRLSDEEFYARVRQLARQANNGRPATSDDEPLELTSVVDSDPAETGDAPLELVERANDGATAEPAPLPSTPDSRRPRDRSISSALAKLDAREASQSGTDDLSVSNRPLDAIVQEMLQPMLQAWLDQNLERIVERRVEEALRAELAARQEDTGEP